MISRNGEAIALWMEKRFSHLSSGIGHRLAQRVREFGTGLNTIHGPWSLLWLTMLSLVVWYVTALAYKEVTHFYGVDALAIPLSQLLLLICASTSGALLPQPPP